MTRLFRIISIIMIAAGFVYLALYTSMQGQTALGALDRPSYYTAQNYTLLFLAGIAVLAFSLMGSFFSWFKALDKKEEVLPNAGYASYDNIESWLRGTTADKTDTVGSAAAAAGSAGTGTPQTTVLPVQNMQNTPGAGAPQTKVLPAQNMQNTPGAGAPQMTALPAQNTSGAVETSQTAVLPSGTDPQKKETN